MPLYEWRRRWGELSQYECLSGRFDFSFWPAIQAELAPDEHPLFLTFLRDPVERVLSLYHWYGHEPNQRFLEQVQSMTVEQFAFTTGDDWLFLDNDATRRIAGVDWAHPNRPVNEEDLQRAKENLRWFAPIGLTERYDESIRRLAGLLEWGSTHYWLTRSQPERVQRKDLEPGLADRIRDRQHFDQALYEYALARDWGE